MTEGFSLKKIKSKTSAVPYFANGHAPPEHAPVEHGAAAAGLDSFLLGL